MRKIVSTCLLSALSLTFTACGKDSSKKPSVGTTGKSTVSAEVEAPVEAAPTPVVVPATAVLNLSSLENSAWISSCYTFSKDPATAVYSRKVLIFSNGQEQTQITSYSDAACTTVKSAAKAAWVLSTLTVSPIDADWSKLEATCVSGCTKNPVVAVKLSADGKTLSEASANSEGVFYLETPIVFTQSPEAVITIPPVVVLPPVPVLSDLGFLAGLEGQTWVSGCYQFAKDITNGVWNQKTLIFSGAHFESRIAQYTDATCMTLKAPAKAAWVLDAYELTALTDPTWIQMKARCASGCTRDTVGAYKLGTQDAKEALFEAGQKSDGTFYFESPVVYFKK